MPARKKQASCCTTSGNQTCCQVEAVLTVDERGQMVLPKDVRDKSGLKAGDKMALVSWEKDGKVCCLSLIRIGELSGMVKGVLEPLVKDVAQVNK